MDKSVSPEPRLEYRDGATNAAGCTLPPSGRGTVAGSPERSRGIKEKGGAVLNLFFLFFFLLP